MLSRIAASVSRKNRFTKIASRSLSALEPKMNSIPMSTIEEYRRAFDRDPHAKVVQNAVTNTIITDIALNRSVVQTSNVTSFNIQLDEWSVTNQKSSGRCWLFAMLNLFRVGAMKKLNVKDFEFSQAHTHFFDKFERANHFMEAMIQMSDRPVGDRTIHYLLEDPIGDGGQFCMAVNIIRRHGVVPKSVFPESHSSSATLKMNAELKDLLRTTACELRSIMASPTATARETAVAHKERRMGDVWRMLCIHLGTPPTSFEWQYQDKDKRTVNKGVMTPQQFAEEYITVPYEDYVCIVNDPRNEYMKCYSVEYLQSVAGGPPVVYLNLDMPTMKALTLQQLRAGLPVWMGCDVGKQLDRKGGLWDLQIYQYQQMYGVKYGMNKRDRLLHSQTLMTHAMMFTGVNVVPDGSEEAQAEPDAASAAEGEGATASAAAADSKKTEKKPAAPVPNGRPTRWRVENSWGEANGKKGFYCMNDNWFDEHMFEIACPRSMLTDAMRAAMEPAAGVTMLPAWDPMGSLARAEGFLQEE